jgi:hypothetical protein
LLLCGIQSFHTFLCQKYLLDAAPEVSETCQVAIDGIQWRIENAEQRESLLVNDEFSSVDPAPPASKKEKSVQQLRQLLLNPDKPTFKRYRALFSLRNINTSEAVLAVCDALDTGSDLFRHEVAFVLGQMEHPASVPALVKALQDKTQHAMVRHEAAEALGSIASPEVTSAGSLAQHVAMCKRVLTKKNLTLVLGTGDGAASAVSRRQRCCRPRIVRCCLQHERILAKI